MYFQKNMFLVFTHKIATAYKIRIIVMCDDWWAHRIKLQVYNSRFYPFVLPEFAMIFFNSSKTREKNLKGQWRIIRKPTGNLRKPAPPVLRVFLFFILFNFCLKKFSKTNISKKPPKSTAVGFQRFPKISNGFPDNPSLV